MTLSFFRRIWSCLDLRNDSPAHSRWREVEVSRSHDGSTPSRERSNYGDKMNTISRYWNDMVGGYHWIRQEDFNETFGTDVKSDLTVSSSQKSQNWNCYDGNLTKGWLPKWKKILRFPTVHSRISTGQWIKSYDFQKMTGLLKTLFLFRLQRRKKNQFWRCLGGILLMSWIPKTWTSLPNFYPLFIQPYPTHSL
jgi:hypothetical protein